MAPPAAAASAAAATQQVWLGLAGDLVREPAAATVDHYTTRIGGLPVFPGPTAPQWPPPGGPPECRMCGTSLSLVLQAYAPLPELPDRVVLLLGCTQAGCGKSPGCWRAVRCQLPPPAAEPPSAGDKTAAAAAETLTASPQQQPPAGVANGSATPPGFAEPEAAAAEAAAGSDWGFGDSWDAAAPAKGSSSSTTTADAFDFSDLTSALTATVQQQQQHQQREQQRKKEERKQQQQQQWEDPASAAESVAWAAHSSSRGSAGPELPEFYLLAELEPDASASKSIPRKELQHVQQLLAAYEHAEASTSSSTTHIPTTTSSSSQPSRQQAAGSSGAEAEAEGEGGASWAGEEYEPDSLGCMQRAYLKFMKRVARQPQQCARYSLNGPLLWPSSQPPQPSPCPACGGPRVFELQLMPALSQMVLEAASMQLQEAEAAEGGCNSSACVNAGVVNAVGNWDWCTVAVFTCQASCFAGGVGVSSSTACHAAYEQVVVVQEADCEVGSDKPAAGAAAGADNNDDDDDDAGSDDG